MEPVGYFIKEEMEARGWSQWDLALKMGGDRFQDIQINYLTLDFLFGLPDEKNLFIGNDAAEQIGQAFGVSKEFLINLDHSYKNHMAAKSSKQED